MVVEAPNAFKYRKNRFNAHLHGILLFGKAKWLYVREYHTFILGIPLLEDNESVALVVVWEGSHKIMQDYLSKQLIQLKDGLWKNEDITDVYHEAR